MIGEWGEFVLTLEYNKKFENNHFSFMNFIGYITPEGKTLDYRYPFGMGGHDRNCVTDFFSQYFYYDVYEDYGRIMVINDKIELLISDDYKKAFRDYCRNELPKKCQSTIYCLKQGWYITKEELLELRLRNLLINCYQNEDFNQAFGRNLVLMDADTFGDWYKISHNLENRSSKELQNLYDEYFSFMILSYLKDTLVQYLGYDSVETQFPRTITTSCVNINERFYNYKLMDFRIFQIPKMIYDPVDMTYKTMPVIYQTEKEEILEKEINSIKKLVRRDERYKYFR